MLHIHITIIIPGVIKNVIQNSKGVYEYGTVQVCTSHWPKLDPGLAVMPQILLPPK